MKQYNKYIVPSDSAWGRNNKLPRVLFYKLPSWLKSFIYSIGSLISAFKVVKNDRHWDHWYIYEMLQYKIEKTRDYIVKSNRSDKIDMVNRDMTICLNLIERLKDGYYECEYLEYSPHSLFSTDKVNRLKEFFDKNKLQHKKAIKYVIENEHRYSVNPSDEGLQALVLSQLKEKKAKRLLFKIMEEKTDMWWD